MYLCSQSLNMKLIHELRNVISQTIARIPISELTDIEIPWTAALSLKDLVYSRAYCSTILSQLLREGADSFPISNSHIESAVVFFIVWTALTAMNRKNETIVSRLGNTIEVYSVRRNASRILFVLYIMFCKSVDNAI